MSFTANMPASGQTLGQTRLPFRNNFFTLRSSQSAEPEGVGDHWDVNNGQYPPGRHKWVRMPDVGADFPGAIAAMFSFYVRNDPASEIFYRDPAGNDIQVSNDFFHNIDTASGTYEGYTLPIIGGVTIKIGKVLADAAPSFGTQTATQFNFLDVTGADFSTTVLYYQAHNDDNLRATGPVTLTTFDVFNSFTTKQWNYFIAVGV